MNEKTYNIDSLVHMVENCIKVINIAKRLPGNLEFHLIDVLRNSIIDTISDPDIDPTEIDIRTTYMILDKDYGALLKNHLYDHFFLLNENFVTSSNAEPN